MSLWLRGRTIHWPAARLKDHVELVNGWPFDSSAFNDTKGTPIIRIRDLLRSRTDTYFDGKVPDEVRVQNGDLLIGMDGDFNSVTWQGGPAVLNQRLCMLRAGPRVDQRFLAYFIDLPLRAINEVTYYTTVKHLSSVDLLDERMPMPPLTRQRAIADFLDAETARIDALIAKKRRMRQLLGERIAAHVEQKTRASSISMVEDDPLPEKWRSVVLRRCFELIQYGIGEASREVGTIAVLGMGNVDHGEIVGNPGGFVDQIDPSLLLEPGDLLFNRTNSLALVGKVALVRDSTATTFASYLVRLRTNHLADSAYLNYLLNTRPILEQARSMALPSIGQANLNPSRYTSIRVPLPPVQIQRSIVSELDLEAATHDRLSSALVRQIELLAEHRQALITAAVTGQLEVPEAVAS